MTFHPQQCRGASRLSLHCELVVCVFFFFSFFKSKKCIWPGKDQRASTHALHSWSWAERLRGAFCIIGKWPHITCFPLNQDFIPVFSTLSVRTRLGCFLLQDNSTQDDHQKLKIHIQSRWDIFVCVCVCFCYFKLPPFPYQLYPLESSQLVFILQVSKAISSLKRIHLSLIPCPYMYQREHHLKPL